MSASSATLGSWEDARFERSRREQRRLLVVSAVGHVLLAIGLGVAPSSAPLPMPAVVSIDLLAAMPAAPARPAPTPAPAPAAPRATPPPPPQAPAALPPPVAKKKVLPRDPAPAKRTPKAKPPPRPRRPTEELEYDDALAALRNELGESTPPVAEEALDAPPATATAGGQGRVDPELAAWQAAVQTALARTWVAPAEYRNSSLRTSLVATVMADGTVVGAPEVRRSSGDPYFDDNAVRAVLQASPLPRPPRPGDWPILFDPTE